MRSILREQSILKDELLDAFGQSLGERGLSLATVRGYLHDLGRLRGWLEGEAGGKSRDLRRITAVDLVNYRQHLLGSERLQAVTINRRLQAIKTLFGWALEKGLVKENVARVVRFVRVAERLCPKGLTEPEVQSLLRAAGQTRYGLAKRNYALIELLLETGLRVGEATNLRIGDVDLHDRSGVVRVRESRRPEAAPSAAELYGSARPEALSERPGVTAPGRSFISQRARRAGSLLADDSGDSIRLGAPGQDHAFCRLGEFSPALIRSSISTPASWQVGRTGGTSRP